MIRDINNVDDWSNYETWCVRRWLTGEPGIAQAWRESALLLMNDGTNDHRRRLPDRLRRSKTFFPEGGAVRPWGRYEPPLLPEKKFRREAGFATGSAIPLSDSLQENHETKYR